MPMPLSQLRNWHQREDPGLTASASKPAWILDNPDFKINWVTHILDLFSIQVFDRI